MDTFTPAQAPSVDYPEDVRVNVSEARFASYSQREIIGLQPTTTTVNLTWQMCTEAVAAALMAFFVAHAGQAFLWTVTGDADPKVWVCKQFGRVHRVGTLKGFKATLTQEFDIA